MSKANIYATVVIPTFNGEEFLDEVLAAIFNQKCPFEFEVLIIDSGSNDKTLEIIKKFPKVKLHQIPNSQFGHGKTRNLAAKMSGGDIMVYLTQDATPASNQWLVNMVEPFSLDEGVFCVFGKQIPRPACVAPIKREVSSVFASLGPDHSLMVHRGKSLLNKKDLEASLGFMSDVNSAVRRDYLVNKIAFRDVNYAEDQALGADVLAAGYLKVYAPGAGVLHSHSYALKKYFHRKYDELVGMRKTMGHVTRLSLKSRFGYIVKSTLKDWAFILRDKDYRFSQKLTDAVKSPLYNIAFCRAVKLASKTNVSETEHNKLSLEAKQRAGK